MIRPDLKATLTVERPALLCRRRSHQQGATMTGELGYFVMGIQLIAILTGFLSSHAKDS